MADNGQEPERRKIIFDPVPRVDGIDTSGDSLSEVRSDIDLLSGRRRRAASAKSTQRRRHRATEPTQEAGRKTMDGPEDYDVVVLGSGEAGKYLAWTVATEGKRAAVIERKYLGGSCPNIACLPSKNVIHSAKVASYFRRSEEFGIATEGWKIDMSAVRARKRRMVDGLMAMHRGKFEASGAEIVMGNGRFVAPRTIEVTLSSGGTRTLRGQTVLINTGSRARIDDTPGLREARPLTHVEALELDKIPGHLIVLGGGYVGLELAQALRRLGSRVTVVERNGSLLHREDRDVSEAIEAAFRDEGIEVATGVTVRRVEGVSGESVRLHATRGGAEVGIEGTHLLVAAGRTPNTDGIGLEAAGVETDERGHVKVDERLQTTEAGVWAVGDCAGSPYFTHIGFDDFRVVRDNLAGGNRVTTGRQVPFCLFTDPELARVGLSETEAKDRGIAYRLAKIPMERVLRTRTLSETRGFLKALIERDGDGILGFTAFGVEAGEVMAVVQIAMSAGLPYTALRDSILTHPTMAEGLGSLFSAVPTNA
jgi:pyruvate/2-oxoglutarate dehydrogenase complex dihydrolipoamide dehydrogenase (E3) component